MGDTARFVSAVYLTCAIWMMVMLGTVAAVLQPMDTLYSALEAGPAVRATGTMTIAVVVATLVAGAAWRRIRTVPRWERVSHRTARSHVPGAAATGTPRA
jgi:hypothetical protein